MQKEKGALFMAQDHLATGDIDDMIYTEEWHISER